MALPDIYFAEKDARKTEAGVITGFEAAAHLAGETDFKLYPGDPRRLFLESVALLIAQQNGVIDKTGKGNLLRYAGEATIEDIGWLFGPRGDRLEPSRSMTTIEFTLSTVRNVATTIAAGTRVTAGNITFATVSSFDIPAGALTGMVVALCTVSGAYGNGMLPGQVMQIIDPTPFVESAVNVTTSSGGADVEDIERYRYRIRELPESFSVAGPDGAYIFWAKTANAGIIDVGVWMPPLDTELFKRFLGEVQGTGGGGTTAEIDRKQLISVLQEIANIFMFGDLPTWYDAFDDMVSEAEIKLKELFGSAGSSSGGGQITDAVAEEWMNRFYALCVETGTGPGNVNVAPLMEGGELPTRDILDAVYDILSDKTKRPLTDFVHVLSPVPVEYDIILTYWIDQDDATSATAIQAAVTAAVDEYVLWQRSKLGRDIIPDELTKLIKQAGARRMVVESPHYTVLADHEVAQQRTVDVRYGGLERA